MGLAVTGCFPVPDPAWLVGDDAELLAVRAEIVTEGPLGFVVSPPPADRVRVEALPGDTIAFHALVVDRARVWAQDELDVAYFACFGSFPGTCQSALRDAEPIPACSGVVDDKLRACAIGRGPDARLVAPNARLPDIVFLFYTVFAVAGRPGVATTDECIDALRRWPDEGLADCMMYERMLATGPAWVLQLALIDWQKDLQDGFDDPTIDDGGDESGDDTEGDTGGTNTDDDVGFDPPPPEVVLEWPNFNPEVERFAISIVRRGESRSFDHISGDTIRVRPDDTVFVIHVRDPRDAQSFAAEQTPTGVLRRQEVLAEQWFATYPLAGFTDVVGAQFVQFDVPPDVDELRIDVLLSDSNSGYGWGSLWFEIDGATP